MQLSVTTLEKFGKPIQKFWSVPLKFKGLLKFTFSKIDKTLSSKNGNIYNLLKHINFFQLLSTKKIKNPTVMIMVANAEETQKSTVRPLSVAHTVRYANTTVQPPYKSCNN